MTDELDLSTPDRRRAHRILGLLLEKTSAGVVRWSPSTGQSYSAELPSGHVSIVEDDVTHILYINSGPPEWDFVHGVYGSDEPAAERSLARLYHLAAGRTVVEITLDGVLRDLEAL